MTDELFDEDDFETVYESLIYYFFLELYVKGSNPFLLLGYNLDDKENLFEIAFQKIKSRLEIIGKTCVDKLLFNKDKYRVKLFERISSRRTMQFRMLKEGIRNNEISRNSIDLKNLIDPSIELLIMSLPRNRYNEKGEIVFLKYLPKLVNSDKIQYLLINELANILPHFDNEGNLIDSVSQMIDKLDSKYKDTSGKYRSNFLWIRNLKLRLKCETIDGMPIKVSDLSNADIQFRQKFVLSFNNCRAIPYITAFKARGIRYNYGSLLKELRDRWKERVVNVLISRFNSSTSDLLKQNVIGSYDINRSGKDYKFIMDTLNRISKLDLDKSLEVLDRLGIQFNTSKKELNKYAQNIREHTVQIMTLMQKGVINTVADLYGTSKIGGRINDLLAIETEFTAQDTILSYMNAGGQSQYSVVIPSLFGQIINIVNSVGSLKALVQTAPWLGKINDDGNVELFGYSANSELLRAGGPLFNNRGNRRPNAPVKYHVISGLGTSDFEGTATDALQYPERVANEIHYLMQNIVYSNINSDKSTEFGIGIPGKPLVSPGDVSNLLCFNNAGLISDIYINQLTDELYAALNNTANPSNVQYYRSQVESLGHFRDVMGPAFVDKFRLEVLGINRKGEKVDKLYDSPNAHLEFVRDNRSEIESIIKNYLVAEDGIIEKTRQMLLDLDLFEKRGDLYITDAIDNQGLAKFLKVVDGQNVTIPTEDGSITRQGFNEANIRTLAGFLAVNKELLNGELDKLKICLENIFSFNEFEFFSTGIKYSN